MISLTASDEPGAEVTERIDVEGVAVSVDHLIGGERVGSATTFVDRSPLDWSTPLADVARGDESIAAAAVTAAVNGFARWSVLTPTERAEHLNRLADLIEEHNDKVAIVETIDMGFMHESMRLRLVARGALNFRIYADLAVEHEERVWSSKGTLNTVQRMPAGPAVIIKPPTPGNNGTNTRNFSVRLSWNGNT